MRTAPPHFSEVREPADCSRDREHGSLAGETIILIAPCFRDIYDFARLRFTNAEGDYKEKTHPKQTTRQLLNLQWDRNVSEQRQTHARTL